jgi:excisionase family DNA binding protein
MDEVKEKNFNREHGTSTVDEDTIRRIADAVVARLTEKPVDMMELAEAAKYLGVAPSTLQRMTFERDIPYYKPGRKCLFKRAELDQWIAGKRIKTRKEIAGEALAYCEANRGRRVTVPRK